ncbi:MAG: hypothetical protein ACTSUK_06875 [Promethearchaeota archaeon]
MKGFIEKIFELLIVFAVFALIIGVVVHNGKSEVEEVEEKTIKGPTIEGNIDSLYYFNTRNDGRIKFK